MIKNTPDGWHNVTPRIFVEDTEQLVSFIKKVFDASGDYHESRSTELRIGDSVLMVSDLESRSSYSACLYVYVSNVEEVFDRAVSEGVTVVEEPLDTPYGDRRAVIEDSWGNMWQIAKYNPR